VNAGRDPIGIATSPVGNYVYVIEQDSAVTSNATTGQTGTNNLLGFAENPTTGALTPLPGVTISTTAQGNVASIGFASGASPSGILEDGTGTHLYVTDSVLNQVWEYPLTNGVPGTPNIAQTDAQPMGMAFDLSQSHLYVTAYAANVLDTFGIGSGGLALSGSGQVAPKLSSVQTGTGPTCVTVSGSPSNANPTHAEYLYTSNALNNNLTGEQVNQQDGSLDQIQGTPFSGSALPTCAVTVPALPLR